KRTNVSGKITITKVPYSKIGVKSEADDPATWITLENAGKVAATEGFINGLGGGVGLWLGITAFGSEYRVAGVDLDPWLMPEAGLTPWAQEVIDRFQTYGEISPSRTGIKLYFLYRVADLDAIRLITGTLWSKNFKERTGSAHAPGFELHIGHRYFAMTGDLYEGCPEVLRVVEVEDIAWLIKEVGQGFTRSETADSCCTQTCTSAFWEPQLGFRGRAASPGRRAAGRCRWRGTSGRWSGRERCAVGPGGHPVRRRFR